MLEKALDYLYTVWLSYVVVGKYKCLKCRCSRYTQIPGIGVPRCCTTAAKSGTTC